jgi:hypothetical protein
MSACVRHVLGLNSQGLSSPEHESEYEGPGECGDNKCGQQQLPGVPSIGT